MALYQSQKEGIRSLILDNLLKEDQHKPFISFVSAFVFVSYSDQG